MARLESLDRDSAISAVQHVLRHLDNPKELRNNPLLVNETIESLRARIHGICETMRWEATFHPRDSSLVRQIEILRRCDLQREPHAAVAADLGISRRQFYRERSAIVHRVVDHFRRDAQSGKLIQFLVKQTRTSEQLDIEGRSREARLIDRHLVSVLLGRLRETEPAATVVTQIALRLILRLARRRELLPIAMNLAAGGRP